MQTCFLFRCVGFVSVIGLLTVACCGDDASRANNSDGAAREDVRTPKTISNSIGLKLAQIPVGEFYMGSSDADPGARDDEKPRHSVRITKPFLMGVYEVTQQEFETVMGFNPSFFSNTGILKDSLEPLDCARFPVDGLSWHQAMDFCRQLSESPLEKKARRVYRLPTEAEWEYACRATTTTLFQGGNSLSSVEANFNGKYPFGDAPRGTFLNRTTTVGSYTPNQFGLYDMHGNLSEWCLDHFHRDYYRDSPDLDPPGPSRQTSRVIRGGNWYSDARDCRSAFRYADIPEGIFYALGFRVACELGGPKADPLAALAEVPNSTDKQATTSAETLLSEQPDLTVGEDWPHWRGPRGDGTWRAPKLASSWDEKGLERVWQYEIGGGYGGIAAAGQHVYVMDRQEDPVEVERILCFNGVNGQLLWSHSYPADYSNVSYGNGPRSTPTVYHGLVYTLGAVGHLYCLDADSGRVIWSKDLVTDCRAQVPIWGLSASPLIFQDVVIVHPGAQPNGCYVAFDLKSGEERWRCLRDAAAYATPLLIHVGDAPQLVCWTPNNIHGVDPRAGEPLWSVPFEVTNGTSVADPIFHHNLALVTSYYDGAKAIRLGSEPDEASVMWHDHRNLRGLMSQPIYRDGYVYLLDKRHGLTCFELETGEKLWDDDNRLTPKGRNPHASLSWINDDNRAIALNSDGELILIRLHPGGYSEEARARIIGPTWAHPAYAGNCVYARSDTEIVCALLPRGE